jgi:cysteine-rich repeat protein
MMLHQSRSGYVLLITVLVVGVMASATAISLIMLGLGIERSAFSIQQSTQAMQGSWTCMENAIHALQQDLEYTGNHDRAFVYAYDQDGVLTQGTTNCRIYPINGEENEDRTICTEATFGNFTTRRLQVQLSRVIPSPIIESWEEVKVITDCDAFTGPSPADCGNGFVEGGLGEECDDGNTLNNDGCSSVCLNEVCGDATQQAGEECDDGNTQGSDGCSETCTSEICGDLIVSTGEECDDGNTDNNDGCSSVCQTEECGDGVTQTSEQCDDGDTIPGDGCDATCTIEPSNDDAPDDYIAYWKLDETNASAIVEDSGLGNYDGDPENGAGVVTSDLAPLDFTNAAARDFDGSNDHIDLDDDEELFPTNMTVSFWTKNDVSPSQYDGIVCKTRRTNWNQGWGFFYYSSTQVAFFIEQWNANIAIGSLNALQWNHIAGTYNGNILRLYVNGIEVDSDTYNGSIHQDRGLHIGRCGDNSDANAFNINGKVDDVRIYNRVLSEDEIEALASGND